MLTEDELQKNVAVRSESAAEGLAVLQNLARSAGVAFDPSRAERALRQAELDVPPTAGRAARVRLSRAAEALDMQLLIRHMSSREAIAAVAAGTPLATFAVTPNGQARWLLLAAASWGKVRLAKVRGDEPDKYLTVEELCQRLGATDPDAILEWLVAQPATPITTPSEEDDHHGQDHHEHAGHHGVSPMVRLLGLLRSESRDLTAVIIYSIAIGVLSLAVPLTAMAVVNTVALGTLVQQLFVLCMVLLVCLSLAAFLRAVQTVVVEFMQRRVFTSVVSDLAYRLPRVELKAFDRQHGPELVNRFFSVLTVQKAASTLLLDGVAVVLQTCIGLVLLAAYHQLLLGFDLILVVCLAFIVFVLGRNGVRTSIQESRVKYRVAGWLEELALNPSAFKLGGGPRFALERADSLTREYLLARQNHFGIILRQLVFALLLQAVASTVLLGLGGYLVIQGQLTLGQLVAAEIVVSLVVASFAKLGKQLETYYGLMAAMDKLGQLMDLPLERNEGVEHHPRGAGASVLVRDLTFGYDESRPVLEGFNLELHAGDRVALLGPNGAGKTTLLELLFGMRQPERGRIEIDGMDLRDLRLESLREHIAIVRGLEVFDGTIIDNVRMGRDELSVADVRRALESVGLLEDLLDLPDGLRTRLSVGGRPLSLGQAERLMLARAIVGNPRLLVLDEVLDDMDRSVRAEVLPAILGPNARWTLLVITHSQEVAALCGRQVRLERRREHKA